MITVDQLNQGIEEGWQAVPCTYCKVLAGLPCLARSGRAAAYTHWARIRGSQPVEPHRVWA